MDRINELNAVFEKAVKEAYEKGFKNGRGITGGLEDKPVESETIEHGNLILRKVERVVRDGDYVKVEHENGECFKPGKIYGPVIEGRVRADSSTGKDKYEEVGVYHDWYGRYESTVEIFEVVESNPVIELQDLPKSPNQQRYETIKRASEFVVELKRPGAFNARPWEYREYPFKDSDYGIEQGWKGSGNAYNCEFIVNHEKRTVVALLKGFKSNEVMKTGIAKCNPSDAFNSDIGKAIALARALEIDIPVEFLRAVQPDEIVMGMEIEYVEEGRVAVVVDRWGDYDDAVDRTHIDTAKGHETSILDDSNAVYPHE